MKLCLYNTYSDNVVGYCKCHKCYLTVKQMKTKNCLGKQCLHLQKNEAHQYWHQRDVLKQKKKQKKMDLENYGNNIKAQH